MNQIVIEQQFQICAFISALDYYWDDKFCFEGESHNAWEIVTVLSGAVEVTEGSRIYMLNAGNMILHAPMEFHTIRSVKGTNPHVLVMSFLSIGELPEKLTEGVFFLTEEEQLSYQSIFSLIYQFYNDNENTHPLIGQESGCRLSAFLIKLARNHAANRPLIRSKSAKEYHRFITEMTERVSENCTLEQLSEITNISISNIKVLFRRYAGISPKTYYDNLRITEAIRLLKNGCSATETAEQMNFSSPNYFSAFFKKKTGMPPAKYIRSTEV